MKLISWRVKGMNDQSLVYSRRIVEFGIAGYLANQIIIERWKLVDPNLNSLINKMTYSVYPGESNHKPGEHLTQKTWGKGFIAFLEGFSEDVK
jgi:hypothetical protein